MENTVKLARAKERRKHCKIVVIKTDGQEVALSTIIIKHTKVLSKMYMSTNPSEKEQKNALEALEIVYYTTISELIREANIPFYDIESIRFKEIEE